MKVLTPDCTLGSHGNLKKKKNYHCSGPTSSGSHTTSETDQSTDTWLPDAPQIMLTCRWGWKPLRSLTLQYWMLLEEHWVPYSFLNAPCSFTPPILGTLLPLLCPEWLFCPNPNPFFPNKYRQHFCLNWHHLPLPNKRWSSSPLFLFSVPTSIFYSNRRTLTSVNFYKTLKFLNTHPSLTWLLLQMLFLLPFSLFSILHTTLTTQLNIL